MKDAAMRIKQKNSVQWSHVLRNEELPVIQKWLNESGVLVGTLSGELVAVCYLYHQPTQWDKDLWGAVQVDEQIVYLHKLSLKDGYTGRGLASQFLNEIKAFLKEQHPKKNFQIRLDCMADKEFLNKLYQSNGFQLVDRIENVNTGAEVAAFNLYEWSEKNEEEKYGN